MGDATTPIQFENDVKEYGLQACFPGVIMIDQFENDVKEYGFQALPGTDLCIVWFENDVKEYGFQADNLLLPLFRSV